MRYHYEKPTIYLSMYGKLYICEHPVYNSCTLFQISNKGLAVIQQRYDAETKSTWWREVDPWLTDDLYLHPGFKKYFDERAEECKRPLSYCYHSSNHVGTENEANREGTMGNGL